ncbi:hypothetical protein Tco_0404139 [Tanacetum coccineum]
MDSSDSVDTSMVDRTKLDEDLQGKPVDPTHYHNMISSLMYFTSSRPDLVFVVCMCTWYQAWPTEKHLHAEQVENGVVEIYFIRTEYQLAGIFTKVLPRERFEFLINKYTQIDIDHAAGGNLRVLSAEEARETIKDCAQCDKHWKNPTSTIPDQTIANLKTQLVENEVVRVMIPKCMAWLDDEPIRDLNTIEDKVDNPSPQSTSQVLPSFEVYTPPVTHPEDVEETIGILMEVEPLEHIKLEDLSLGTITHDLFLSSKGFPSVDEPEPQLLPNFSPLDVNLGYKRGTDPPINPYTPDSFRMKVVKPLTIQTPASSHVENSHPKDVYGKIVSSSAILIRGPMEYL